MTPNPPQESPLVLLADDDVDGSRLLSEILKLDGFEVEVVRDGLRAKASLQRRRPDVVLLDLFLPACNGAEVLQWIREQPDLDGLLVFCVSASEPSQVGADPDAFDEFFRKPYEPAALSQRIRERVGALDRG